MGQTGSHAHKHARNEIIKGTNLNHSYQNPAGVNNVVGFNSSQSAANYDSYYNYQHDDAIEDEEISYPPILPTKDSDV
mgnify:CR=1 FL=1